jgi:hypothetical protein
LEVVGNNEHFVGIQSDILFAGYTEVEQSQKRLVLISSGYKRHYIPHTCTLRPLMVSTRSLIVSTYGIHPKFGKVLDELLRTKSTHRGIRRKVICNHENIFARIQNEILVDIAR